MTSNTNKLHSLGDVRGGINKMIFTLCVCIQKKNDDFLIIETVVFFFVQLIRVYLHVYVCVESQEETTTKK